MRSWNSFESSTFGKEKEQNNSLGIQSLGNGIVFPAPQLIVSRKQLEAEERRRLEELRQREEILQLRKQEREECVRTFKETIKRTRAKKKKLRPNAVKEVEHTEGGETRIRAANRMHGLQRNN